MKVCSVCQKQFDTYSTIYCSIACGNRGRSIKRVLAYLKNPKLCKLCKNVISFRYRNENTYCSRKCSAIENNGGVVLPRRKCLGCENFVKSTESTYCSKACWQEKLYREYIVRWKRGEESGVTGHGTSERIRRHLQETRGEKCQKCDWHEVNPVTNKVPVQLEHVDGNWRNNAESNLLLLCPNCHSLTSTYGALNKGHGREGRRFKNSLSAHSLVAEFNLAKIEV